MKRTIVIGCDNAAVHMKEDLSKYIIKLGYPVEDAGCISTDDATYYPVIAKILCESIIESNFQKEGVLICGTGLGMAMCANKFPGIRAGVCHDSFSGERLKLSNHGNVICFGERVIGVELAKKILGEWLTLDFKDGSSTPKIKAIEELELETMKQHKPAPLSKRGDHETIR